NFQTSAANPAGAGVFRCSNNQPCLYARNAANSGDVEVASLESSNQVSLGGASGGTTSGVVNVPRIRVNGGVSNGGGLAIASGSTCTTQAVTNNACSTTVTWGPTFADTNYGAWCVLDTQLSGSGAAVVVSVGSKTTTTAVMVMQNLGPNATATQYSYWC